MIVLKVAAVLSLASAALAADCGQDQPRKSGDPSGAQIAKAIGAQAIIDGICVGNWRVGDEKKLENTFNHGNIQYAVSRTDNTKDLQSCQDAFKNIIEQCISNDNFWGGSWSLGGETYSIKNGVFPNNGLAPGDDGGPKVGSSTKASVPTTTVTSNTGPITPSPKTSSIAAGAYATVTKSIQGLTANSATTTTNNGHTTILPIWYVGSGVGIIVIPGAGIGAGGVVPPPVGLPTLTIGDDGKPSTKKDSDTKTTNTSKDSDASKTTSSSASTSSSCSQCAGCQMGNFPVSVDEDALGYLDGQIGVIIPGARTPKGTVVTSTPTYTPTPTPTPTPTSSSEPLQSAVPIDSPACAAGGIDSKDLLPPVFDGTNGDLNNLLFKMRQEVCAGTCSTAGPDIPGRVVSVFSDQGQNQCEIRVAVTEKIEAYMYRATSARGDQQQQCWDSLENIISKCVHNDVNKGWWNGNHASQFYEAGVRPLNDGTAKNNYQITEWLGWSTVGLTCGHDCVGFIPSTTWCNNNCRSGKRHIEAQKNTFSARRSKASAIQARQAKPTKLPTQKACDIAFTFPGYPETTKSGNTPPENSRSAGTVALITNNGWWDFVDENPNGVCFRRLRKTKDRVPRTEYATEHIYEKQLIKLYFNWLAYDMTEESGFESGKVADCTTVVKPLFQTKSSDAKSKFNTISPAQKLANEISCLGGTCPDDSRASEFYILQKDVNGLKAILFGELSRKAEKNAEFKEYKCDAAKWSDNRDKLANLAAVFQYIQKPEVAAVFVKVTARMRAVLADLDADPFYSQYKPAALKIPAADDQVEEITHNGWAGAYDYFMAMFLTQAEEKSNLFVHECVIKINGQIDADTTLTTDAEKLAEKTKLKANQELKGGMWTRDTLSFGAGYRDLMNTDWS